MKKRILQAGTLLVMFFYLQPVFSQVKRVDAVSITVKEMDRSLEFYTRVLGFRLVSDTVYNGTSYERLQGLFGLNMRVARLQLGDEFIELADYLTAGGRAIPADARSNDLFFQHIAIVVSDMDRAFQKIKEAKAEFVSTSPQTLPASIPAAAGIRAFYFHDPDGHNLELIFFPQGKGQEKWQYPGGRLFLGIDHTAIGVSNTEQSHQFYATLLGVERKGDSWNKGTEQEHLNNVEGASLHITGYRSAAGPGIEFLQYLQPGPGKAFPADTRTDDLWYWQTILFTDNARALYNTLKEKNNRFISKELVLQHRAGRDVYSFIVKDPDGHALLITE